MTHYTVLVCLDGTEIPDDVLNNRTKRSISAGEESVHPDLEPYLEEALKPFDENMVFCDCPFKLVQDDDCPFPDLKDCIYYVKEGHCAYYNPQSKWDWWVIGGRWSDGILMKKDGELVDVCRVRDLDLDVMVERDIIGARSQARLSYEAHIEKMEDDEHEHINIFLRNDDAELMEKVGSKEAYVEEACKLHCLRITWAILTKDGQWLEPGKMGWFGMDGSTIESKRKFNSEYLDYIAALAPEDVLVVVDVHI